MNHVDKDSRPDLLKGADVKVKPRGGRKRWEKSLKLACTERQIRGLLKSGCVKLTGCPPEDPPLPALPPPPELLDSVIVTFTDTWL